MYSENKTSGAALLYVHQATEVEQELAKYRAAAEAEAAKLRHAVETAESDKNAALDYVQARSVQLLLSKR
jgi:hypothetical protein